LKKENLHGTIHNYTIIYMPYLILLRHGQSQWNLENKFTGWVDIDLTAKGEIEATHAGEILQKYPIDIVFTSVLMRAIRTAEIALKQAGIESIPIYRSEKLNERHYGDLQGLNKDDIGKEYGSDQLKVWRRSYDIAPPNGESLKMTQERVLPYFHESIIPELQKGKNVLITAHGNTLRALIAELDKMSKEEILELNIPTATPIVYTLEHETLKVLHKEQLND
jgi:2,3-bisphosphoglycerate-dependent phosphoglycerate mutase